MTPGVSTARPFVWLMEFQYADTGQFDPVFTSHWVFQVLTGVDEPACTHHHGAGPVLATLVPSFR